MQVIITSGSHTYFIKDTVFENKPDVIDDLPDILQLFFELNVLELNLISEQWIIRPKQGPFITVREGWDGIYYRIPFHASCHKSDYIHYWFLLFCSEHASDLYSVPKLSFVPWIYETDFPLTSWDNTEPVYPGTNWMVTSTIDESYHIQVIQHVG